MSTHYTSSKPPLVRIVRWKRFIFELFVPLFLVISTISAYIDGVPYAFYVMCIAWVYIAGLTGALRGSARMLQVHAAFGCLYFFWISFTSTTATISTLQLAGFVFGAFVILAELLCRIDKLAAPGKSGRAAEFPGIYRITCKPNGMQYIGMTERPIKARWEDHLSNLNAQRHHNPRLQLDWNTYRPELFKWEVLEVVTDPVWVRDRERAWQDKDYDSTKRYNPPNLPPRIVKTRRPVMKRKSRA